MYFRHIRTAVVSLLLFTVITGIIYPVAVTGLARLFFPEKANGSLILKDGKALGSELIGQSFTDPRYFWGRLSATSPIAYNSSSSSGSNYGPTNAALLKAVKERLDQLRAADPSNTQNIPVDLVTSSGSGLDPHISIAAALYQLPRIARIRNLPEATVRNFIDQNTDGRGFGVLGEPGVNVLRLNLALDNISKELR